MRELDKNEVKIVRELIKNPRISDNQIGRITNIPVMTVNRKRKLLENQGLIKYFTSLDTGEFGTQRFSAKQLYIIKFKPGVTRENYIQGIITNKKWQQFYASFISLSYLGEKDGSITLILVLDAESESKLLDEFNGKIIPNLKEKFGEDCITEISSVRISNTLRRHHNYIPIRNMENGIMKKDWPDDWIFVDKAPAELETFK